MLVKSGCPSPLGREATLLTAGLGQIHLGGGGHVCEIVFLKLVVVVVVVVEVVVVSEEMTKHDYNVEQYDVFLTED